MNESARTITYVAVAAVAVGLAWILSPPGEITPESLRAAKVGESFFKDFNPTDATSIRVVGFDEAKATSRAFGVKLENGKWTIPTRHNYPADGADRLAKTAASTRGIKREELVSSSPQNQEQLGVLDPLDEDKTKLKGRGQRITLNKGDDVLADFIIGKQVKDRPGFFYIRKPGENETYAAKITIDLSTKFADWVETDLLKIDKNDLTEIVVDNYKVQGTTGRLGIIEGEKSTLTRDKSADPWKLEGLDDPQEELDITKVNAMIGALDDLKLAGVRPKPKGFNPDLSIDREFVKRQSELQQLVIDMQSRGFSLAQDKNKELRLYADEGELTAATNKGVVYTLKFGSVFLGDEAEIEIGAAADNEKDKAEKPADGEEKPEAKVKSSEGKQSSRYLFVTASFDEHFLGDAPEKPAPPEEMADATEPAAKTKSRASKKEPLDEDKNTEENPPAESQAPPKAKPDEEKPEEQSPKDQAEKPQAEKKSSEKPEAGDENCLRTAVLDDDASEDKKSATAGDEKPANEKPGDDKAPVENKPIEKDAAENDAAGKTKDEAPAADGKAEPAPKAQPKKSADDLKKEYDAKLKKYEIDLKAHQDKVTAGKKLVDDLNARFGGWYYVISAENFNKLHLSRKELVKEKAKTGADKKSDTTPEAMDEEGADAKLDPDEPGDQKKDEKKDESKDEKKDEKKDTDANKEADKDTDKNEAAEKKSE